MTRWIPVCLLAAIAGVLLLMAPRDRAAADTVKEPIKLFNGKDLTNFYTFLKGEGKNKDAKKVFTVEGGAIRVSGEVYGCFATEKEYENYRLIVEYKWGEKTYEPRLKGARDSGILLHSVGEDGVASGCWMESVECQMIEGGTGDIIIVGGKARPTLKAEVEYRETPPGSKKMQPYYKPGGELKTFDKGGRVNWSGRDPNWTDTVGFQGKDDAEKKHGEWNTVECVCDGGTITIILNGKTINKATECSHTKGKIQFQSEGAEVFFRRIELLPLKK